MLKSSLPPFAVVAAYYGADHLGYAIAAAGLIGLGLGTRRAYRALREQLDAIDHLFSL